MNPELYREHNLPPSLKPYFRRVLVALTDEEIDIKTEAKATGYPFLGWLRRGRGRAFLQEVKIFDSQECGFHVSGQIDNAEIRIEFTGALAHILVEFSALGHHLYLGVPAIETTNRCTQPTSETFSAIQRELSSAKAPQTHDDFAHLFLSILQKHIPKALQLPPYLHAALKQMERNDGACRIDELAKKVGVSERQLRREFQRSVGLSPKTFCNILQVNTAFFALLNKSPQALSALALECGFSDQAHLTHAFQKFLGDSPMSISNKGEALLARFVGHCRAQNDS